MHYIPLIMACRSGYHKADSLFKIFYFSYLFIILGGILCYIYKMFVFCVHYRTVYTRCTTERDMWRTNIKYTKSWCYCSYTVKREYNIKRYCYSVHKTELLKHLIYAPSQISMGFLWCHSHSRGEIPFRLTKIKLTTYLSITNVMSVEGMWGQFRCYTCSNTWSPVLQSLILVQKVQCFWTLQA